MNAKNDLAYLGPRGTFSEILSRKHYGNTHNLVPKASIEDIFEYVEQNDDRQGIVPIENSSGGIIHSTVDLLIEAAGKLVIREALSIKVTLALAGHKGVHPTRIYSHFAPLHHCDKWLKSNLDNVERYEVSSTAEAARIVKDEESSVALCPRDAAELYELDILEYPIAQDIENVTQFYCIGHNHIDSETPGEESCFIMTLPNNPGALVDALAVFKEKDINLTRVLSRPIRGKPQQYIFLINVSGSIDQDSLQSTVDHLKSERLCDDIQLLGSYPIIPMSDS